MYVGSNVAYSSMCENLWTDTDRNRPRHSDPLIRLSNFQFVEHRRPATPKLDGLGLQVLEEDGALADREKNLSAGKPLACLPDPSPPITASR